MPSYSRTKVHHEAVALFQDQFGRKPQFVVSAPGRVNLMGEHVDYNDGFVMPLAIERRIIIAADLDPGCETAEIWSSFAHERASLRIDKIPCPQKGWKNYIHGVIACFLQRELRVPGFSAVVHSDLPTGGGLSSSAALEVATATLIEAITDTPIPPVEKALLCQKAENEFAGVPCGFMDQFTSIFGREDRLVMIDCRSQEINYIPMDEECGTILITDSKVSHDLKDGAYARRRQDCVDAARSLGVASLRDASIDLLHDRQSRMSPTVIRRARHVISEIQRTQTMATAIESCDIEAIGRLMYDGHASLRDDYEVSCPEVDFLVELSQNLGPGAGIIGTRMTGGGFGGCCVSLVHADAVDEVSQRLAREYHSKTGITPAQFVTRPAMGAEVLTTPQTAQ